MESTSLMRTSASHLPPRHLPPAAPEEVDAASALGLTPTQIRVMMGVRLGLLNKQIAVDMGIAEKTVKAHMTAMMRKLGVSNRTQVALVAQSLVRG